MKPPKKPKVTFHHVSSSINRNLKSESSLSFREPPKVTLESLSEDIIFEKNKNSTY